MKRLAVAFHSRRQEPDAVAPPVAPDVKKRPGFFSKPAPRTPAELHVPPAVYSSSSSDGSVVQTPEADEEPEAPTPTRSTTRWASWIKSKSSTSKTRHVAAVWDPPSTDARPKRISITPSAPSTPESDDESDHYDDELPTPPVVAPPPPPPQSPSRPSHSPARSSRVLQPATLLRSQMNIRAITLSALIPPFSPPPLLHLPSGPQFPRSTNPARSLQPLQSTRAVMHRTALLRRLESQTLTRPENESIAAFGHRPKQVVPKTRRKGIEEEAMSDVKKVRFYSRGLQSWIDRPCFEERAVLWTWDADARDVVAKQITGSDKAVASLEFSEGLEALAGYGLEPFPSLNAPASLAPSKSTSLLPPLRTNSSSPPISAGSSTPNASTGPPTPTALTPTSVIAPRKILRFLPDPDPEDPEDNIPLGYQVLTKRESERLVEERERQAREEERKKKAYAAEVLAARARREGARSGSMHEAEKEMMKDRRSSYTRPSYDPALASRRMASEPDARSRPHSLSRPPSITDVNARSRPPSIRSERIGPGPSSLRTPPLSPPPHPQAHTVQSVEDLQEAKRRRRTSNLSEGAGSMRSRAPSAPSSVSGRPPMHARTTPRAYSSGPGMSGMSMMPMPVPPLPVSVMPMPVFIMPGAPQFYMPQPMPTLQQLQQQYSPDAPLLPPIRPGLPVSRSAEGLQSPRSNHSARQTSGNSRPMASPRRASNGDDVKRASRASVQVPPVSYMQQQSPSQHPSGSRGPRPSPTR